MVWKWQLRPVRISKGPVVWGVLVSTKGNNVFRQGLELIFQILLYIQVAIFNYLPLILKIVKLKLTPSSQVSTCSLQVTIFSWIYLCTDFHWFWFSPLVLILSATSQDQAKLLWAWLYIIILAVGINSSLSHIFFPLRHFILKQISVWFLCFSKKRSDNYSFVNFCRKLFGLVFKVFLLATSPNNQLYLPL